MRPIPPCQCLVQDDDRRRSGPVRSFNLPPPYQRNSHSCEIARRHGVGPSALRPPSAVHSRAFGIRKAQRGGVADGCAPHARCRPHASRKVRRNRVGHDDLTQPLAIERSRQFVERHQTRKQPPAWRLSSPLELQVIAIGSKSPLAGAPDHHHTIGLRQGQCLPEQLIHHAENRGVHSDPQRQARHRRQRISRIAPQYAQRVMEILPGIGSGQPVRRATNSSRRSPAIISPSRPGTSRRRNASAIRGGRCSGKTHPFPHSV